MCIPWRFPARISLDGRVIEGRIKHFDRYALVMEIDGADQLVFKHAIVTVGTPASSASPAVVCPVYGNVSRKTSASR